MSTVVEPVRPRRTVIRRPGSLLLLLLLFWALGASVRNYVTWGSRRRAEGALPLVPGEVVIGWQEPPKTSESIVPRLVTLAMSRVAGAARVRGKRDVRRDALWEVSVRREGPAPPSTMDSRVLVLHCRPGLERELMTLLLRLARFATRRGLADWLPGSLLVSRVPWLNLDSHATIGGSVRPIYTLDQVLRAVGVDLNQPTGNRPVTIGVLDVGVDRAELPANAHISVMHWRKDEFDNRPAVGPTPGIRHGTLVTALIAALVPEASINVLDVCDDMPDHLSRRLSATWLSDAAELFQNHDLLNVSLSLDPAGQGYAPHFERMVRRQLVLMEDSRPLVMVAACGNLHEQGVALEEQLRDLKKPNADTSIKDPVKTMGFPASHRTVIAVSSTDEHLRPIAERTQGKDGRLYWHMPGGTAAAPLGVDNGRQILSDHGSSLATALYTGVLARALTREKASLAGAAGRAHTLAVAEEHTRDWSPGDPYHGPWPRSRGLLDAKE